MRKQTKKQLQEFNNEVIEILNFYGASQVSENKYYMNSDKIGKLHITLDTDTSQVYSIYTEFEDTKKAVNFFNVRLYNGKMHSNEFTPEPGILFIDELLDNYNQIVGIDSHAQHEIEKAI